MELQRFGNLAQTYGADLARWPEAERTAAETLRTSDPGAAGVLADARELDQALDRWFVPPPTPSLRAHVLSLMAPSPERRPQSAPVRRWFGVWLSGAGLAAAGVLGITCGAFISSVALADAHDQAILASATTDGLSAFSASPEGTRLFRGSAIQRVRIP